MKMKKLLMILITFLFIFMAGCQQIDQTPKQVALPDLTNMSRAQIEEELDALGLDVVFQFASVPCYNESYYDKFVSYSGGYEIGRMVDVGEIVRVQTTQLPLNINNLDKVKLEVPYEGKSFIDDGIGVVRLVRAVDGDTARFIDPNSKTKTDDFPVRFLGIDTPESTYVTDPWGKKASAFTKSKLENAETIVLEAEGPRTETYGRYLAYVWVDGVLLNLELVQEAYSNSTLSSKFKYHQIMAETAALAKKTGRRFYGERDLDYNYGG